MKKTMLRIAVAAAFVAPLSAQATIYVFKAKLEGAQEVPSVDTPALGTGTLIYDDVANMISLNWAGGGLSSPITDAHIHAAPPGVSAGVIFPIAARGEPDFIGLGQTFFLSDFTAGVGNGPGLFPADRIGDLLANGTYLNVHTEMHPGGEMRGQLILQVVAQPVPEPETYALMLAGLGFVGWAASRRRSVGV